MHKIFKSFKVELDPNNKQITLFKMNAGACRWAFNWALEKKIEAFNRKENIPSAMTLHKDLVKLKGTDELHWAYKVSKCSFQNALRNCDEAFRNFFRNCKEKIKGKKGFPKFKSKKGNDACFKLNGAIHILNEGKLIQLPRIGKIKLKETNYILTENVRIISAIVSKHANKWFVSVLTEIEIDDKPELDKKVGVDLGIKTLATCSNGEVYNNPKALKKNLKKLKRFQRNVSRKKKGSKNREKARLKLNKLHYKISNIRKDCLHKVTSKIINENQVIVLENLKVSNMMKNHKLAQAISDVGMFEFKRQIIYKAGWSGREVILADTFYPSSKLCSCCGWKNENLTLADRVFKCQECNNEMDRDLNAAINLENYKDLKNTVSYTEINACGNRSSSSENLVSLLEKQEINGKLLFG